MLKHPGGTPLAEKGLASDEPVLALPWGLCGRGVVDDGVLGVMFLTNCTGTWEARGMVLFLVLDLAVGAGALLAVMDKLSSTVMGTCFSVVCLLFGVMAPVVAGPVLSVLVFLSA